MRAHDVLSAGGFDLSSVTIVDVQPVAAYVDAQPDGTTWTLGDLPNVAPPWEHALYEWRFPGGFAAVEVVSERDGGRGEFECLARSFVGDRRGLAHLCDAVFYPDATGSADTWHVLGGRSPANRAAHELVVGIAALAISFCHCVNVTAREVQPPTKESKRDGRAKLAYHVLDIAPMTRALDASGAGSMAQRLHICRGHFKTYSPDRPLLGRHAGTFWWQDSLRGDPGKGVALKSYRVASPQEVAR